MAWTFDPNFTAQGIAIAHTVANGGLVGGASAAPGLSTLTTPNPLTVVTSAGNTLVSVDTLRFEASDPAQMNSSGFFDLGLSGQLPYSVSYSTYFLDADTSPVPLAIDGSFTIPLFANLAGSVDIAGSLVPFSVRFTTPFSSVVDGDVDLLGGNMFQITLDGGMSFSLSLDPIRRVPLGTINGADLEILFNVLGGFSGTAVVPEPSAALLLVAGMLGLKGWRRRLH